MFTSKDIQQIENRGSNVKKVEAQLRQIRDRFPFLTLEGAASIERGIFQPDMEERENYTDNWEEYKAQGHQLIKFVPASGAASRMFKDLFAFLSAAYDVPTTEFERQFFAHLDDFPFAQELSRKCKEREGKDSKELIAAGNYKAVVSCLLEEDGLNYGNLPKGLLLFHSYPDGPRTPMEEHLVEAALYANSNGEANIHFTVSHSHLELFKQKVAEKKAKYEEMFGIRYHISFSEQKPSTDTIAANADGSPFRNEDGSLLFRPGGHGALIENLNDLDGDIIFIKNIDNVVPDRLKSDTTLYKNILAGILVTTQQKAFNYLELLDRGECDREQIEEIIRFVQHDLCCLRSDLDKLEGAELMKYLHDKLNRPMRVCGVVRNQGEAGGGPFLVKNADGSISLQILESSQIDKNNPDYMRMFTEGTHFNPVDLACATKDYKGKKFNLLQYVDPMTGFVSSKSKNGKELLALELPGLWNGAMSDWNTIFVEVPLITFNPVKAVNDLLRKEHR